MSQCSRRRSASNGNHTKDRFACLLAGAAKISFFGTSSSQSQCVCLRLCYQPFFFLGGTNNEPSGTFHHRQLVLLWILRIPTSTFHCISCCIRRRASERASERRAMMKCKSQSVDQKDGWLADWLAFVVCAAAAWLARLAGSAGWLDAPSEIAAPLPRCVVFFFLAAGKYVRNIIYNLSIHAGFCACAATRTSYVLLLAR